MDLDSYPVHTVDIEQESYPSSLNELRDPPLQVYYRGNLDSNILKNCVAIVGSRNISRYGRQVAEQLTEELVLQGITIISGFMYGIDAVAHSTAVAGKGRTIAVFGSGINQIYPPDHENLYTSILRENGAILSEYDPEQKPKPWMYAKRNRIVAALANMGVIVIEASEKSGSLITAEYAIKLRRSLYAVPGPINSDTSKGTNWLIKTGKAKLITDVSDIKGIINIIKEKIESSPSLSPSESKIYNVLKNEGTPLAVDEISILTGIETSQVSMQISLMHLHGLLDEVNGKYAVKNK